MKNILVSLLLFSLFLSCDSKDELDEVKINESYSFVTIEYNAGDSSVVAEIFNFPAIEYSNGTNSDQIFPVNSLEGWYETSLFESEDPEAFKFDSIEVYVPSYIDVHNNVYTGYQKWEYSNVMQQQQKPPFEIANNICVKPNTKVIITEKLFFNKYKVNYRLILENDITGKYMFIEGVWTGTSANHYAISVSSVDL